MLAPPGLPKDISNLPRLPLGNFSYTKVGDMLERGRLLGSNAVGNGLACIIAWVKLKSVISIAGAEAACCFAAIHHQFGAKLRFDGGGHRQGIAVFVDDADVGSAVFYLMGMLA